MKGVTNTKHCPCCGHAITKIALDGLKFMPLERQEKLIVAELERIYPRGCDLNQLVEALYFDDPEGGPETAEAVVRVRLSRLRKRLTPFGWTVAKGLSGPGSQSRYRLIPVPDGTHPALDSPRPMPGSSTTTGARP